MRKFVLRNRESSFPLNTASALAAEPKGLGNAFKASYKESEKGKHLTNVTPDFEPIVLKIYFNADGTDGYRNYKSLSLFLSRCGSEPFVLEYDDGVTDKFCDVIFKSLTKSEIGEEGTFCETLSLERQSYWYEKLETTLALQKTGTADNAFPLSFPVVFNGWSFINSVRINNSFHREAPVRITIKGAIAGTAKGRIRYIEIQLKSAYSGEVVSSIRLDRSMTDGETLVIDPEAKKITLTHADGKVENAYDMTDKTKQSFLYIPQGEFILEANITDEDSGSVEVSVKRYLLD